MIFHLFNSVKSQSVLWLSQDKPINEIHAFPTPTKERNLIELYLFRKDLLSNLLSIRSQIRPLLSICRTLPVIN
jgi:hypothetical protein